MVGQRIGGVNVFGGGLALYRNGVKGQGGVGQSASGFGHPKCLNNPTEPPWPLFRL
jgi:hypothetical protein